MNTRHPWLDELIEPSNTWIEANNDTGFLNWKKR